MKITIEIPDHKASFSIEHNTHKDCYQTVEQYLDGISDLDDDDFLSSDKDRAIETNELWCAQWYPDTPIGFYRVFASSIEKLNIIMETK